jgi:hypothetical protein
MAVKKDPAAFNAAIDRADQKDEAADKAARNNLPKSVSVPLSFNDVMELLSKPIPKELIKERPAYRDKSGRDVMTPYIEWTTAADILDQFAPGWTHKLTKPEVIGTAIHITCSLTIMGVTREGVGTGAVDRGENGIKKAASDALKRAAVMFKIGRELYKDDEDTIHHSHNQQAPRQQYQQPASGGNGNSKPVAPAAIKDPSAHNPDELITPRQLVAIRAIANAGKIDAELECTRLYRTDLKSINRRAASAFIDYLKNLAEGGTPQAPAQSEGGDGDDDFTEQNIDNWEDVEVPAGVNSKIRPGMLLGLVEPNMLWFLKEKWARGKVKPEFEWFQEVCLSIPDSAYARNA